MGKHDKGAFGELLAELETRGIETLTFRCKLQEDGDSRWMTDDGDFVGWGRTGEEALRSLLSNRKMHGG